MQQYAHITGWGMSVPERVLTNEELARTVDTSDEWIVGRTGIHERRIAGPRETTASLAIEASRAALECADVSPRAIDLASLFFRKMGARTPRRPGAYWVPVPTRVMTKVINPLSVCGLPARKSAWSSGWRAARPCTSVRQLA